MNKLISFEIFYKDSGLIGFSRFCGSLPRVGDEIQLEYTEKARQETFKVIKITWKEHGDTLIPLVRLGHI